MDDHDFVLKPVVTWGISISHCFAPRFGSDGEAKQLQAHGRDGDAPITKFRRYSRIDDVTEMSTLYW